MEVYEAVHTVLAVREFQSKPVPDSVVRRIINPMDSKAKRGEYRLPMPIARQLDGGRA